MSKYIPNTKRQEHFSYTWSSSAKVDSKEEKSIKESRKKLVSEKNRIESIELDKLSFKDLYQFPFKTSDISSWVYDSNGNFIFQFEAENKNFRKKVLEILNNEISEYNRREVRIEGGLIQVKVEDEWKDFILIRGWGNLTGGGAYNLESEYAAKIQDTLAEYIVEKLNIK